MLGNLLGNWPLLHTWLARRLILACVVCVLRWDVARLGRCATC